MEIVKTVEGTSLLVALKGRLDTNTSSDLEAALEGELEGITELVFDFAELDYLSSAGLRILLSSQKTMKKQGKMVVRNVNDIIMEVFEVTGFIDILTVE